MQPPNVPAKGNIASASQRALLAQLLKKKKSSAKRAPLSYAQERLWFLNQFDPDSPAYNLRTAAKLTGQLEVDRLQRCLNTIVERHGALRATFSNEGGQPVQLIAPTASLALPVDDLTQYAPESMTDEVARRSAVEVQRPFDLRNGPLLRARLLKLAADEHVLLMTMHHAVSDGWSIGLMLREISALYEAFSAENPSPLAPLPIQYDEYARWQRDWLRGDRHDSQLAYWQQQLAKPLPALALPVDFPRPQAQSFRGARHYFQLPKQLTQPLKKLSQQHDATLFMTLLAAYKTLLFRLTGQTDMLVGTPVAGRNRQELHKLIGLFINTLVIRTQPQESATFTDYLAQVRQQSFDAFANQDLPFEKIVEAIQPARDASRNPIFQTLFILQNVPMQQVSLSNLTMELMKPDKASSQTDLMLTLWDGDEGIHGFFEYNTDLFEHETIARWSNHFAVLLDAIAVDSTRSLTQLPLLSLDEQKVRHAQHDYTQITRERLTVVDHFAQQAARTPNKTALVFDDRAWTYAELDTQSNQLANHLGRYQLEAGELVGICIDRSAEMVIALLAVLKAGAAYVPLDPSYPKERLHYMLTNSSVSVVLAHQNAIALCRDAIDEWQADANTASLILIDAAWDEIAANAATPPTTKPQPSQRAYVIYTSGSTGKPKGVQISHRAFSNFLLSMQREPGLSAEDHLLAVTTLSFDIAGLELFLPLISGATVEVASRETAADGHALLERLAHATIIQATPATYRLLLAAGWEQSPQLKVLCGGEALLHSLAAQLVPRCASLWNMYGPTETTVWSAVHRVRSDEPLLPSGTVSVGKPIDNTQLWVLDSMHRPAPIGVAGDLYIGGAGLSLGYLNRPELTAERFVTIALDSHSEASQRLYATGDLARMLPDGSLEFLGRRDQQVKVRGFRIELGEIETALSRHPLVNAAAAAVFDGPSGQKELVAYFVTTDDEEMASAENLRAYLSDQLPTYMVPSLLIPLEQLPLTLNGKVDRRALPAPTVTQRSGTATYIAPRTAVESQLAEIWSDLLTPGRVGIDDNFFALGGHSLLATQLVSRIRKQLNADISLRDLFATPTIRQIAQRLAGASGNSQAQPSIVPSTAQGNAPAPLSFAQQRLWFLDQFEPNQATYNIPVNMRLQGQLDIASLQKSVDHIVRRHTILRTSFANDVSAPVQIAQDAKTIPVGMVDLSDAAQDEQEAQLRELAVKSASTPFDLSSGPLLRISLVRLAEDMHVLLLTMHHIVSDGWSIGVLINELSQLYRAFVKNRPNPLPPLPIQYADYARWQREPAQNERFEQELGYWRAQLADAPTLLELPTDFPRPAQQTFHGAKQAFTIDPATIASLRALSQTNRVTLFSTLLSAFQVLLHRYSRQSDIIIGTPVAGRTQLETEQLIGLFVNTLALRTDLSGNPAFTALLQATHQTVVDGQAHQETPFEKLVDALQPTRSLSHAPFYQVMLILQDNSSTAVSLPALEITPLPTDNATAKFDLTLSFIVGADGEIGGSLEYNTDLFSAETAHRLTTHLHMLLKSIAADPSTPIDQLNLLPKLERDRVQLNWNTTAKPYPLQKTLPQLLAEQVARTPDAPAVRFATQTVTYAELDQRTNQLAHALQARGVQTDQLVGVCLDRSLEMLIALLGVMKAGAAYVPLDPAFPQERLRYMVDDAGIALLLTESKLRPLLTFATDQTLCLDSDWSQIAVHSAEAVQSSLTGSDLAYVIYTSGSTGRPKGVQIEQRSLVNFLLAMRDEIEISAEDTLLAVTTPSFDIATLELYLPLIVGATVVIAPFETTVDSQALIKLVDQSASTIMQATPITWRMLLASGWPQTDTLKVLCGGEAMAHELGQQLLDKTPTVWNVYGPTETTVWSTAQRVTQQDIAQKLPSGTVSIGHPIANTTLHILDDQQQPVPIGVLGELFIGGTGVARGYLNRPELTQARFVTVALSESAQPQRLYKTGDLARFRKDGTLEFFGRIDSQVKVRGFRIELGDIESNLSLHETVAQVSAIARPDEQGIQQLIAYIVCADDAELDASSLRIFLQGKLPGYMIPSHFVMLDALPLTPNGKVDRKALPAPKRAVSKPTHFLAPSGGIEEKLAAIFGDALGVEQIGRNDNFFDLGAHSFLLAQIHRELQEQLEQSIAVIDLFKYPSISALSTFLEHDSNQIDQQVSAIQDRETKRRAALKSRRGGARRRPLPTKRA